MRQTVLSIVSSFLFCAAIGGCNSNPEESAQQTDKVAETTSGPEQATDELDELRQVALRNKGTRQGLDKALELFAASRGEQKNQAMGFLLENFYDQLNYKAMIVSFLKEIPSPSIENWFKQMIAAADGENRARATLAYARYVDQIPEFCDGFVKNPHLMQKLPAAQQRYLQAQRTDEQTAQLAQLLQRVIDEAPAGKIDGISYAQAAQKELFELQRLAVGMVAPDIVGEDLDGMEFRLSDYRGKVVMLDFWGHWCPPCRAMYPQERELVSRLASKPFVLLGVNSDRKLEVAQEAVRDEGLVWRHFWNGKGGTVGNIADQWNIIAWPTVYLIDGDGVIRYKDILGKDLDRAIEKLLAEQGHLVDLTMSQ